KSGAGTLTLGGANTFTGTPVTLAAGTLSVSSKRNFGAAANSIAANGSLKTTATFTLSRTLTLNSTTTFDCDSGVTLTISSAIGGSGGVVKIGAGILYLTAANTFSGTASANAGILRLKGDSGTFTTVTPAGEVFINPGGTFDIDA